MPLYESVVLARQDISSAQVDALVETLSGILSENGGSVQEHEYWGLRNLAYKINKNRKGHYVMFRIDAPAAAVHEFERVMRFNEDVMRSLTLRVDAFEEGPSIQMRQRAERRERRGDRGDSRPPRRSDDSRRSEEKKEGAAS